MAPRDPRYGLEFIAPGYDLAESPTRKRKASRMSMEYRPREHDLARFWGRRLPSPVRVPYALEPRAWHTASISSSTPSDSGRSDVQVSPSASDADSPTMYTTSTDRRHSDAAFSASKPGYTAEQKFFIMHSRIVQIKSWEEISNDFAKLFLGRRSAAGLSSAYYRIRKEWGLVDVLQRGPQSLPQESEVVDEKARLLPQQFLRTIGFRA